MQNFVFALLLGIGPGAIFGILGVGVVIAFRGSGVINFAHGAIAMYTAFTFNRLHSEPSLGGADDLFLPWVDVIPESEWVAALRLNNVPVRITVGAAPMNTVQALLISLAMAALLGVLAHLIVFRPLRNASPLSKVIASVGIMIYLQALAALHFGSTLRSDDGWGVFRPDQEPIRNFLGLGSSFPRSSIWLLVGAVVVTTLVWAVLRYTRFGLAARAVNDNERAMVLLRYSADRIAGLTWVGSAVAAGAAGVMFVGFTQPSNLTLFIVPALGAALVGNLTSVGWAAVGGIAIAVAQSGGVFIAARPWWPEWLPAAGVRQFIPLLIVIAVLFLRGDRLPVRGAIISRGEPRAPAGRRPVRTMAIGAALITLLATVGDWRLEAGLTSSLVAAIFMLSLVVLVGYLGQISLAQWSIAGLAAFAMVRLSADGSLVRSVDAVAKCGPGWPDPLAFVGGVVLAIAVGLTIGVPAARVRGLQLAVISIAAVIAVEGLLLSNPALMGGGADSNNPTPQPTWFGAYVGAPQRLDGGRIGTPDNPAYTALVVVLAVVLGLAVANLRNGMVGRQFLAIRSNERAAAAMGINVTATKLLGFGIAAAIAGVAGALFTYKLPSIPAGSFGLFGGLTLLAFVYIAGITTVPGAFVGGILVSGGLLSALSSSEAGSGVVRYNALIGAAGLILAAVLANGEGVIRLSDRWKRWRARWHDRDAEVEAWGPAGRLPVLVLGGIAAADFIARGGLAVSLMDIQDEFGFSDAQAALIPFADVVAAGAVIVGAGYLADRVSRTRLLLLLLIVWAVTNAATGLVQTFGQLFIVRVALGAMTAVDDPSSTSLLADYYPARLRHKAYSWRLVAPVLGGAIGTLAIGIAVDSVGWRASFVVGAIPAAALVWFVAKLPEPARGASDRIDHDLAAAPAMSWRHDIAAMRTIRSLPLLIASSALAFGPAIGVTFWAPTFLRRHDDLSAAEAAGLFGFASLLGALLGAFVASRGPARFRSERRGKIVIAAVGSTAGAVLLMLAYSPTPVSMKFPLFVFGAAGLIAAAPVLTSLISEVTPAAIRGTVFSINGLCRLSLSALAPLAIGLVADRVTFVDRDVPLAIVDDQQVEDRADRFECVDGTVVATDGAPEGVAGPDQYRCGDDQVGHLGAGMVAVLTLGALAGPMAWLAGRRLDDDLSVEPDRVLVAPSGR
jgi:branched-chain amino acid transport system permease protein